MLRPSILTVYQVAPERLELNDALRQHPRAVGGNAQKTSRFEIAFWNKVFYPVAVLVMMIVALPFAQFQRRSGGVGFRIFAGTMLGLAFFLIGRLFSQPRRAERLAAALLRGVPARRVHGARRRDARVDRAAVGPGTLWRDASLSAIVAGFVAVVVGYTSSAAIVFEAARALGADERGIASWMGALGVGMGVTCIALSLAYRAPIVTAWSTPGAALLATSAAQVPLAEAIGAFVLCGRDARPSSEFPVAFDRLMRRLPVVAGGGDAGRRSAAVRLVGGRRARDRLRARDRDVRRVPRRPSLGSRATRCLPCWSAGLAVAGSSGRIDTAQLGWAVAQPVFTMPAFSWAATIGLALPLFVVTMASQNVPGIATLRAAGYSTPASPLVAWTGVTTRPARAVRWLRVQPRSDHGRDLHGPGGAS